MKNVFCWILTFSFVILISLNACQDPCEGVTGASIGQEYFSVTYLDAAGNNPLLGTYRLSNVEVFIDSTGGGGPRPQFARISEDLSDGKFGPFFFTQDYIDPATRQPDVTALANRDITFDYYFKKDTFGIDTFTVSFLLSADACSNFWSYIRYSLNGDPLPAFDGLQQAEIVVTE